jgi:hypothetical protein
MIFIRFQNDIKQDLVIFAGGDVLVEPDALNLSPESLRELVQLAHSLNKDPYLIEAIRGGSGPLAEMKDVTYEDYLELLNRAMVGEAANAAKKVHTRLRRRDFNSKRSQLILAMLEAGVPYVCSTPGCKSVDDLTVDHVTPLSRGGTDDLSNLRFMCRQHNGIKRDSVGDCSCDPTWRP